MGLGQAAAKVRPEDMETQGSRKLAFIPCGTAAFLLTPGQFSKRVFNEENNSCTAGILAAVGNCLSVIIFLSVIQLAHSLW